MTRNYKVTVNGTAYDVNVEEVGSTSEKATAPVAPVTTPSQTVVPVPSTTSASEPVDVVSTDDAGSIAAPMPGKILKVMVEQGDAVEAGQVLLLLEAMKMENEIFASTSGTVARVACKEGDSVNTGDTLLVIA